MPTLRRPTFSTLSGIEITRRLRGSAVAPGSRGGGAARTDERDFAGAAPVLSLNMAREHQRLVQIQRRGAGLRRL